MRILLVDNDPFTRKRFKHVLSGDHEVVTARDGTQALDMLDEDSEYDVVVLDLEMPELSGWQVYKAIEEFHPELEEKIIFWTGSLPEKSVYDMGVPYLSKPVDPAQFMDVLPFIAIDWLAATG